MARITLIVGSNLGNKINNIEKALIEIEKYIGNIKKKTKIKKTKPWGFQSSNIFFNCAVEIISSLSPIEVIKTIKSIELKLGRIKVKKKDMKIVLLILI